jgi:hypothetical protein
LVALSSLLYLVRAPGAHDARRGAAAHVQPQTAYLLRVEGFVAPRRALQLRALRLFGARMAASDAPSASWR